MDKFGVDENKYSAKKVVDTVGAGDAYSAILCLGYLNKMPIGRIRFNGFISPAVKSLIISIKKLVYLK